MNIVFQFDIRTIALFVALTFLVQATVIGAQAYLIRELKQYHGVGAALFANLCVAIGLILRLFAGEQPTFLVTILANAVILAASGLYYISFSRFLGFRYSRWLIVSVMAISVFFLLYFTYWKEDIEDRAISLSLGSVAMTGILIRQLWRAQKTSLRFSASLMLASFLVYGIFLIIRTASLIMNHPADPASFTPMQSATYLFSFALSFFWSMGFVLMVSQRLRNDLMEIATIDVLTRIPNRRATQAFLEKELSRMQRNEGDLTVFLIDIDDFKQVNDRWGHVAGDRVLIRTAEIFQSMIRKQDFVGRWGGEEFLIVVPGPCNAKALAERVRSGIATQKYNDGAEPFGITISIGAAVVRQADPIDQILRKTDQALYRAKRMKNAVSMEGES